MASLFSGPSRETAKRRLNVGRPAFRCVAMILALTSVCLPAASLAAGSPLGQIPPTTISVTVDRGPQSTYFVGDPITICVSADTRVGPGVADYAPFVRITDVLPNGSSSVVFEGQVAGQRCTTGVITPPVGTETIRADYLVVGITGQPQIVNAAQVSFQVAERAPFPPPPPPAPPPTATAPPTPSPLPPPPMATPSPTVAPSPEPLPPPPTSTPAASAPGVFSAAVLDVACEESGSARVELAWSESMGFERYHVYRDGEEIWSEGPKSSFAYTDAQAPAGATLLYQVVARNAVGAQAADPDPLEVETPDCLAPTEMSEEPLS